MRFNKLDLNLLVALDEMLHTCNITQAAKNLHMSQSAMSNCLARLRDYFGDELLCPVGRKMELTPKGEMLKDDVHDLLLRINRTLSTEPVFNPEKSDREFRIAVSDYTSLVLMPKVLSLAQQQNASVRFSLIPQFGDPARILERGEADIMVIPLDYCSSLHPTEVLFREHFTCVFWSGSQLANKELDLESYQAAGHVVMQPSGSDRPAFGNQFLQDHGVERQIDVSTYNFLSEPILLIGTDRIATVPTRLAEWSCCHFPLQSCKPPIEIPVMEQAIQWHKYRSNDPGLVWLLDLFRKAARTLEVHGGEADQDCFSQSRSFRAD